MKKIPFLTTLFIAAVFSSSAFGAETLSVDEIVRKTNLSSYYGGDDGKAEVNMTITDGQGRERTREFVILRRDVEEGGAQEFYVYFKKPSDVRKMVFMVHKFIDKDDDRWLYLPALDLVKRIAASDKRTSFVGSDFVYEDVSGRSITEDDHTLEETTDTHYILKNVPKDPGSVEFAAFTMWIDKNTFIPSKIEYQNNQGEVYRRVEALKIETIEGIPTVLESRVQDLASGGQTLSVFSNVKYNIGLGEDIFTERYLRRAPKEVR